MIRVYLILFFIIVIYIGIISHIYLFLHNIKIKIVNLVVDFF